MGWYQFHHISGEGDRISGNAVKTLKIQFDDVILSTDTAWSDKLWLDTYKRSLEDSKRSDPFLSVNMEEPAIVQIVGSYRPDAQEGHIILFSATGVPISVECPRKNSTGSIRFKLSTFRQATFEDEDACSEE